MITITQGGLLPSKFTSAGAQVSVDHDPGPRPRRQSSQNSADKMSRQNANVAVDETSEKQDSLPRSKKNENVADKKSDEHYMTPRSTRGPRCGLQSLLLHYRVVKRACGL